MTTGTDKSKLLAQHDFFRDMPAATIAALTAHARVLTFDKGELIFAQGDEGFGLLAVMSGTVRISVSSDGATELTLRLIGADEVFGEIALLDGQPRTADATAMTACRLLLLERRDFLATLMAEPSAALSLLKVVSTRLRRTSRQLEQASFGPMSSRLAQAILSIGRTGGPQGPIRMSQRQIGNLIGLSRESTNRYLRAWHRAGVLDLESGAVTIRDWKTLARFAAEDG